MRHMNGIFLLLSLVTALAAPDCRAQSPLLTTFAGGNGQAGNMFEVKSLTGVIINDFDINFAGTGDFEVWALNFPGTYLFNQNSNANWTLLATVNGLVSQGVGTPTPMGLSLGFDLPAGVQQAFYITSTNGAIMHYTNGTTYGNLFAANADLEFYEGHGGAYFNLFFTPRVWNGRIHYAPRVNDDLELLDIPSPVNNAMDCSLLTASETVTLSLRNNGLNTVPAGTALTLTYQVNTQAPVTEAIMVTAPLTTGQVMQHSFAATIDLSQPGNYTLNASLAWAPDQNNSNDTLSRTLGSGGPLHFASFPYQEDFVPPLNGTALLPAGWVQETADASGEFSDWMVRHDAAPGPAAGPAADHTTGISGTGGFAYVDDDGDHASVNLRSPCFDLSALTNPNCRFFLYSLNTSSPASDSTLAVDVLTLPGGSITMDVLGPVGSQGSDWAVQSVDLSAFSGQVVQLRFRVDTTVNPGNDHDVAIDDFLMAETLVPGGQPPQPGTAVLDLNNPHNVNLDPLSSNAPGPYFSTVPTGDTLVFRMSGLPLKPILLLSGPVNAAAATFPGIGSIDLGTAPGPGGIPGSIVLLADGSNPVGINPFFVTSALGSVEIGFTVPNLPPGVLGAFQCVMQTNTPAGLAMSNAVEVTIQ